MAIDTLTIYIFVSFFYIISPGPAIFLAIYNGAIHGRQVVMFSALGNIIGLMVLSLLSISGLSALLLASSTLFIAVKFIGASYLIFLGFRQFSGTSTAKLKDQQKTPIKTRPLRAYFQEGLLVAVTNPKPILFFAALFPQFLNTAQPVSPQFMIMTGIFMLFSFLSLSTYGYLAQRARGFLSNQDNVNWFHRISGGLFIIIGISIFYIKKATP